MNRDKKKALMQNLAIFATGLLVSIIILELALAILNIPPTPACVFEEDADFGFKLKPNSYFKINDPEAGFYEIKTNSFGFRDIEFENSAEKETVFLVGDSFVMGNLLQENQRFSNKLQDDIRLENYNFFNLGIAASATVNQEQYIYKLGEIFPPKKIFLFFYMNDFPGNTDPDFSNVYEIKDNCLAAKNVKWQGILREVKDTIGRYSRIYGLARIFINNNLVLRPIMEDIGLADKFRNHDDLAHLYRISDEGFEIEAENTKESLKNIRDFSLKNNIDLYIMYIPYKLEFEEQRTAHQEISKFIDEKLDLSKPKKTLFNICSELRINCIDLTADLQKQNREGYFERDNHLNETGNTIIAEKIIEILK